MVTGKADDCWVTISHHSQKVRLVSPVTKAEVVGLLGSERFTWRWTCSWCRKLRRCRSGSTAASCHWDECSGRRSGTRGWRSDPAHNARQSHPSHNQPWRQQHRHQSHSQQPHQPTQMVNTTQVYSSEAPCVNMKILQSQKDDMLNLFIFIVQTALKLSSTIILILHAVSWELNAKKSRQPRMSTQNDQIQFSSVQSLNGLGRRVDMRDDSTEIFFQSFLQEALVSSSGMGRDVHSLIRTIKHRRKLIHFFQLFSYVKLFLRHIYEHSLKHKTVS